MDITTMLSEQFLIPFFFVLAVTFGALNLSKVFGPRSKSINIVIAIVIGFFAATYEPFVTTLFDYLPMLTWFFVVVFLIVFVLEIAKRHGGNEETITQTLAVTGIALLVFLSIGVYTLRNMVQMSTTMFNNIFMIIGLVFFIVMAMTAIKQGPGKAPKKQE